MDRAAECVANRTRRVLPFIGMSSNSALAISASALDSCKEKKQNYNPDVEKKSQEHVASEMDRLTSRMKPNPLLLLMKTSLGSPYLTKRFLNCSSVMSLGRLPMNRRQRCVYCFSPGFSSMDRVALKPP